MVKAGGWVALFQYGGWMKWIKSGVRCSQILESLFHWQFWAHIGSWAMLWRRAMIMFRNTSWWKNSYCKPKGVLCLTGDDLLLKWCTWENNGLCRRSAGSSIQYFRIYPIQWGAGVRTSTASLVHQCSSPSQVDFRAVLVETYLRLRLLCGTDAAKVTIKMPSKCFTQKGCLPKGALSRDIMILFVCYGCYGRCKRFQGECWRIPNFETPPIEQQNVKPPGWPSEMMAPHLSEDCHFSSKGCECVWGL